MKNHFLFFSTLSLALLFIQCDWKEASLSGNPEQQIKKQGTATINGVSFVAPPKEIGSDAIALPKTITGANYLSIMPYAFIPKDHPTLSYNNQFQWWGESSDGTISCIKMAHEQGYAVMLKPHVWKSHGSFTGHHEYSSEKEWELFEKAYSDYILYYAKIADSLEVAIFCIGTEWERFVTTRSNFWHGLIKDIRSIYKGKLTYAANWDEYKRVPFWQKLDLIGIDAYFPLTEQKTPSVVALKKAMLVVKEELKAYHDSLQRPILFTEYGYRSGNFNTLRPWEVNEYQESNLQAQSNAYQAFYESFWNDSAFAGGFLWKWFANHAAVGGTKHSGFTPQNKPASTIIHYWYTSRAD
jgi:hypothetical protein